MLAGFKSFIMRGNVIDLAVGVIIGAAFGGIVDSLTKDVITPVLGMLGGQPDFSAWKVGAIGIGNFINAVLSFLIKAAALYFFIVVPFSNLVARLVTVAPPTPSEQYLKEIRDLLQASRTSQAKA
ncbi:MAG TPA: large conductance mechanosensitive channel protein MscL [Bryobacteraceae bacterium]|jgi:large conductance mechanosensitive channel|nr:large conductance mechanosensitive channel protein MscL [Bryobacteraceae bacterium]